MARPPAPPRPGDDGLSLLPHQAPGMMAGPAAPPSPALVPACPALPALGHRQDRHSPPLGAGHTPQTQMAHLAGNSSSPTGQLGRQKRALQAGVYPETLSSRAHGLLWQCQGDTRSPCVRLSHTASGHVARASCARGSFPSAKQTHCSGKLGKPFSPGIQFPSYSQERPCAILWPTLKLRETELNRFRFHI